MDESSKPDEQREQREVLYMQIAVVRRLVDVNESRFIRSCSFVVRVFRNLFFFDISRQSLVSIFQPPVNQFSCNA